MTENGTLKIIIIFSSFVIVCFFIAKYFESKRPVINKYALYDNCFYRKPSRASGYFICEIFEHQYRISQNDCSQRNDTLWVCKN